MKKKIYNLLLIIVILFTVTGCSSIKYPEIEKDAIAIKTEEYIDKNNNDAEYLTIEYNGRTYMPYGTLKGTIKEKDIDKCIGYIVQDEKIASIPDESNKDIRIYTLKEVTNNDFLMEYYIGTDIMNQPNFYRAVDTKNKNIDIPKYIDSMGYKYWIN